MVSSYFQRLISIFLIFLQIASPLSLFAYSGNQPTVTDTELSIQSLIQEREAYDRERSGLTNINTFSSHSEFLGSSYVIESSSRLRGEIEDRVVTSDLLYNTMIRNISQSGIDPSSLAVRSATSQKQILAEKKFGKSESGRVIAFEFGIPDNHLIFSKPVLLSVDSGDIPDGSWVNILVHHAGDTDYNTSGLMIDSEGECLPDGTATKPAQKAQVMNSKVSFYTCGASTFALGYVPAWDVPSSTVFTIAPTADNKIIIGGQFTTVGGVARNRVARVSTGGMLDTSFNPNANNIVYASAIQSDGKILIGGTFTNVGGTPRNYIARLNTDGTLDATFNASITTGSQVRAIKIQSDGQILIGGTFSVLGGQTRNNIARLNTNGTVDLTFANANPNNTVYAIAIQGDGRILIGGLFNTVTLVARTRIARVSALGVLDNTFNPNVTATAIWDVQVQSDGAIVFGGQFTFVGGVARNNIARVSALGVLDNTFNPNVTGGTPVVYTILIESVSGNIIFGGIFTTVGGATARGRIARYSSTGVLDTTLNPNANTTVYALGVRSDGTIAIGGAFTTIFGVGNRYIAYAYTTGTVDTTYHLVPNSTIFTLAPTADNKIIIGGQFTTVGGVARNRVARVSTGGMLDTSFNPNANNIVYASAIQSDGKILIGGTFTNVGGTPRNYIARLNTDGTLDATFNASITTGSQVRAIKIQSDGQILIGGTFSVLGGQTRNNIARLNTNGSVDLTFANANANNTVYAIAIQPSDNKILIGGLFTQVSLTARTRIARVSPLGVLDATFNPVLTATAIWDIQVQTNGSIVFGGQFTFVGGVARNNIARVSAVGVLDNTFNPNVTGGTPVVYTILIESVSGNIIFGGTFTTVGGATTRNRIARYSSTGVLDTTLNPNAGNTVYTLGKDQELNLLAGGAFTTMNAKIVAYFSWIGLNTDFVSPTIDSITLLSGSLLPVGNFVITTTYSDVGVGINSSSVGVSLERWNGLAWGSNVAATYISGIPSINTSISTYTFASVPYGKYRFRLYVSDIAGNQSFIERTFYIDAIEWNVSQPSVDIGTVVGNIQKNSSPDEFVITVQTVGAPFSLTLSGSELDSMSSLIGHWTGIDGFGYEKYNGAYSGVLSTIEGGALIISQPQVLNTNGDKNIYTYRIQFGALVGMQQPSGEYVAPISLQIVTNY